MDHFVCLDAKAKEIENLVMGNRSMIIHGADEIKLPYGQVNEGDAVYFINNNCDEEVIAIGVVTFVFNSEKLSFEESFETIIRHQDKLQLPDELFEKWAGKRYLVLIGLDKIKEVEPFPIDKRRFTGNNDWLTVEKNEIVVTKQKA